MAFPSRSPHTGPVDGKSYTGLSDPEAVDQAGGRTDESCGRQVPPHVVISKGHVAACLKIDGIR